MTTLLQTGGRLNSCSICSPHNHAPQAVGLMWAIFSLIPRPLMHEMQLGAGLIHRSSMHMQFILSRYFTVMKWWSQITGRKLTLFSCCCSSCCTLFHLLLLFFLVLGLLVLAAAGRSPKMSSVLLKRSSSEQPFGFLLFSFLVPLGFVLAALCNKDISVSSLRLEEEKEGQVRGWS